MGYPLNRRLVRAVRTAAGHMRPTLRKNLITEYVERHGKLDMDDSGADVNAPGGGYHPPDEPQRNRRSFQELRRHII